MTQIVIDGDTIDPCGQTAEDADGPGPHTRALVNNAGIGEGGPIAEIPLDLVRRNFEVNVFAPLALTSVS
jgi:NAD(P)-dependent dehydrogenase (short-subunit alcohol dehydrogenase family)